MATEGDLIKKRMWEINQELIYHSQKYHGEDSPEISDFEYDLLFNQLKTLQEKYPQYIPEDSIINKVGNQIKKGFAPFTHHSIMGSLENAMNFEELKDFILRKETDLGHGIDEYFLSVKLDGLALELIYQNGDITVASTRGDGEVGENVTKNALQISNIPHRLSKANNFPLIIVRGEVIVTKKSFERINQKLSEEGQPPVASPRNVAAGTMRQLNEAIVKERDLKFYPYGLSNWEECSNLDPKLNTQSNQMQFLSKIGFDINPEWSIAKNLEEASQFYQSIQDKRFDLDYEIDGIVVKINSGKIQKLLGEIGRRPRYAIAWKLPPELGKSKLESVHFQVGRTGKITPVANLTGVRLGGAMVKRATLHNYREIQDKDIRIGDQVTIIRSGDVIPKILEVLKAERNGSEKKIIFPTHCPVCQSLLENEENGILTFCRNDECPSRQFKSILHFVSKNAMDIEGLGPEQIQELIEAGKLSDSSDLYVLEKKDFEILERFGDKLIDNLVTAIEQSKEVELARFIYALGIHGVGLKTAQILAKKFLTLENILQLKEEDLLNLDKIGNTMVKNILDFFKKPKNIKMIKDMKERGVVVIPYREFAGDKNKKFYNKKILFTGTLSMPRRRAKELAEEAGAEIVSSVSANLDYLIVGEKPGSKKQKAESLHVKIITEEMFLKLLNE